MMARIDTDQSTEDLLGFLVPSLIRKHPSLLEKGLWMSGLRTECRLQFCGRLIVFTERFESNGQVDSRIEVARMKLQRSAVKRDRVLRTTLRVK